MTTRRTASLFFVAGCVLIGIIFAILSATLGQMTGMSAGPVSGDSNAALIPILLFLYFIISTVGIYSCYSKKALRIIALVSHLDLLGMFTMLESQNSPDLFLVFLFLSPWLGVWVWLLSKYNPETEEY
jgi:hypothetical protein